MADLRPTIAVIGCGNATRSDDGVGSDIIRRLSAGRLGTMRSQVRLLDAGTDGLAAMFAARGCRSLVIVDACRSGASPGAVFEVPGSELEPETEPPLASHELRWDHAVAAGRRIYGRAFPLDFTVFLIEAETTAFGLGLSAAVAAAAASVARRIEALAMARVDVAPEGPNLYR